MQAARRTGAVALKVLRALKHDRRSLALMLVAPILAMTIFGFIFGSEVRHVPVVYVSDDRGDLAGKVVANVDAGLVSLTGLNDTEEAARAVADGRAVAFWYFPPDFTENATVRPPPQPSALDAVQGRFPRPTPPPGSNLTVRLDGSNVQLVQAQARALSGAILGAIEESGGKLPIRVQNEYAYAEGAAFMDFFVPGIMPFAALLFTTLLTLLAFVGERTSGTLPRLLVTPVREIEIVGGYALAFGLIGVVQGAILLGVALLGFGVLVTGSLALTFLIVALMAVDALSIGILFSAAARREAQAVQFLPLIVFPTFLLSGIFVPLEALPPWLAPLAWAIPPTYAIEALRDVMLRGWGLAEVWPNVAALAGFALAFQLLAVLGLRRQRA